jgi:hypothetical protein
MKALVSVVLGSTTAQSFIVHSDGEISQLGKILNGNYSNLDSIKKLLEANCDFDYIDATSAHPTKKSTRFHKWNEGIVQNVFNFFEKQSTIDYMYIFDMSHTWYVNKLNLDSDNPYFSDDEILGHNRWGYSLSDVLAKKSALAIFDGTELDLDDSENLDILVLMAAKAIADKDY